jgi:ABC-2 type transport system permease protein
MRHTTFIALYTLVLQELKRVFRIWPQTLLPSVITMTLYFLIFGRLIGSRIPAIHGFTYIQYILPGLIIMPLITNSYTHTSSSFFVAKFQRNIEEMLTSPMPNAAILWGYLLAGIIRGLLVGIAVTIVSLFFTKLHIVHLFIMFYTAIITALLFSLAGLINGIYAKKFDDVSLVPTFVLTPLTYLGGIFYSVHQLPQWGQTLSFLNPIFYIVSAFRDGFLGVSSINPISSFLFLTGLTIALYVFSLRALRTSKQLRA